jgi:hypothetical protein
MKQFMSQKTLQLGDKIRNLVDEENPLRNGPSPTQLERLKREKMGPAA